MRSPSSLLTLLLALRPTFLPTRLLTLSPPRAPPHPPPRPPHPQLQLTEKDLGNEITKVLQAQNPDAPHNIIQFSHKERVYKATAQVRRTTG